MSLKLFPRTFRIQMALLFGMLSILIGLPTYLYINSQHRAQLIEYKYETLKGVANSAAAILADSLAERHREIVLLTQNTRYQQSDLQHSDLRTRFERVKKSYSYYSWIGVADTEGRVQSATSSHLEGVNVSHRPWFQAGLKGPYLGDVHEALLLAKLLPNTSSNQPTRFIDFSAPITDDTGQVIGVLGAHAHWNWAQALMAKMTPIHAQRDDIELFIFNHQGEVIYPENIPESMQVPSLGMLTNSAHQHFIKWNEKSLYLTASATVDMPAEVNSLDWQIVARQPESTALAEIDSLEKVNLLTMITAGIMFLLLAWVIANHISRPVEILTKTARLIESGNRQVRFSENFWARDLQKLSDALRGMYNTLIEQRNSLTQINKDLETKVAARTAELQQLNVDLENLARTDVLTGLANRMHTNEQLVTQFALFKRSTIPYSILMVDIDFFKRVNDTYGHAVGDKALKHVATIMQSIVRKTDFIGRNGGEEFLAILPMTNSSAALTLAEKIRKAIASTPIAPIGKITVSIGVQEVLEDDADECVAVIRADQWMYRAKQAGRNKVMPSQTGIKMYSA